MKLIARRIQTLLLYLVHIDQVGFMIKREVSDNTIKPINLLSHPRPSNLPITIDGVKSFDIVDWDFLWLALSQIGLGTIMLDRIMALYSCPSAKARTNGCLSESFAIFNGTGQGWLLSSICSRHGTFSKHYKAMPGYSWYFTYR